MANGALADLTSAKSQFPNSKTWLQGLAESGEYGGKTYAVPYYAGARAAIYNIDLYKQAGVSTWAWGTGETIVIVAMMLAGYRVSGRLAKRRVLTAAMTAADNPDDLIGA